MNIIDTLGKEKINTHIPSLAMGDVVDVKTKIVEGEKERIQVFSGVVIAKKGSGIRETFTVRRIVQGEGVERIFPVHSPRLISVKVTKSGKVRRAKLYYMRKKIGKATRLKEKFVEKKEST
ncbi:MAG: 50S ribosomal protein L19 [Candidatus Brocadiales bacterium]